MKGLFLLVVKIKKLHKIAKNHKTNVLSEINL